MVTLSFQLGRKSWSHPWFLSFSLILSANPFGPTCKMYLEPNSSFFSLLLFWSGPSSFLVWINCYSFTIVLSTSVLYSLFLMWQDDPFQMKVRSHHSLDSHYSDLWNGKWSSPLLSLWPHLILSWLEAYFVLLNFTGIIFFTNQRQNSPLTKDRLALLQFSLYYGGLEPHRHISKVCLHSAPATLVSFLFFRHPRRAPHRRCSSSFLCLDSSSFE